MMLDPEQRDPPGRDPPTSKDPYRPPAQSRPEPIDPPEDVPWYLPMDESELDESEFVPDLGHFHTTGRVRSHQQSHGGGRTSVQRALMMMTLLHWVVMNFNLWVRGRHWVPPTSPPQKQIIANRCKIDEK